MSDLESKTLYDPAEVEPRIVRKWLESGLFHPAPEGEAEDNYSIAIPPPNVTGVLHMGHALNNSIQDCLARHQRMRGRRTKWILGTDHAGIATQTQVERALEQEGSSKDELGREQFVERVWAWRKRYGGTIIEQLERLGASADYETERFTLDEGYVRAVLKVFVALYEKGFIYRDRYMVNWDPGTRSRRSPTSRSSSARSPTRCTTSTTPGLGLRGDHGGHGATGDDARRHGDRRPPRRRPLPPADRGEGDPAAGRVASCKIIADDYVKPEFGTGALKITPAHDPNDFEIGRRHGLGQPSVIGEDGRITARRPSGFRRPDASPRPSARSSTELNRAGADRPDRALSSTRCRSRSARVSGSSR